MSSDLSAEAAKYTNFYQNTRSLYINTFISLYINTGSLCQNTQTLFQNTGSYTPVEISLPKGKILPKTNVLDMSLNCM